MANTGGMCNSFKKELLCGQHAFGTATLSARPGDNRDDIFAALFVAAGGTLSVQTQQYTTSGEVPTGGNYTQGGTEVPNTGSDPVADQTNNVGYWNPSGNISWNLLTIGSGNAFDAVLIYNKTQGNKAISVHTFGSPQTVGGGTFTLTIPTNAYNTALIRLQ